MLSTIRRKVSQFIYVVVSLTVSTVGSGQSKQGNDKVEGKPNVIYILADDLGYGELGCYGQQKMETPNIDKLAAEGMKFTQHYVGTPVCGPSRCNLLTGQHSGHAIVRGNYGLPGYQENVSETGSYPIPENVPTIANIFKQAGYTTGAIGKWGIGNYDNGGDPQKHGFDFFEGYYDQRHAHNYYTTHLWQNRKWDSLNNPVINVHPKLNAADVKPEDVAAYNGKEYSIDRMTSVAADFIVKNKNKPFFLYLPYTLPHLALQIPQQGIEYYKKKLDEKPHLVLTGYVPTFYPHSTYATMVSYLDKQVGVIEGLLQQLGLEKNTIVIFCSDNGPDEDELGPNDRYFKRAGNLRGQKEDLYEGGMREPFIVKWPGKVKAGSVNNHISATYDMMETFAELLQVNAPKNDGISLLPTLMGNKAQQKQHAYLYWEYPDKGGKLAVRMGKWKGVKTGLKKDPQALWQIFNLETDEAEKVDIAAQHPELVNTFDDIVKREHTKPVRPEWDIFSTSSLPKVAKSED